LKRVGLNAYVLYAALRLPIQLGHEAEVRITPKPDPVFCHTLPADKPVSPL